jgi:hypothetical protein
VIYNNLTDYNSDQPLQNPLNGITLGQRETDCQYPTDTSKRQSFNVHFVPKSNLGNVFLDKFDPINQLIPLSGLIVHNVLDFPRMFLVSVLIWVVQ